MAARYEVKLGSGATVRLEARDAAAAVGLVRSSHPGEKVELAMVSRLPDPQWYRVQYQSGPSRMVHAWSGEEAAEAAGDVKDIVAVDLVVGNIEGGGAGETQRTPIEARHDLVPPVATRALAVRFGRGAERYGDRDWERGRTWHDTLNHAIEHLAALHERLAAGTPYDPTQHDDDAAAVMWAMAAVIFFERGSASLEAMARFYDKPGVAMRAVEERR